MIKAWHFVAGPLPGVLRDGRPVPPDGEWLEHDGPIVICESGLHASVKALDTLTYAPGPIACRVELAGVAESEEDKIVGRARRVLWRADATDALRAFACDQALSVAHLWEMPAVVRQYLETRDESLRTTARDAASIAASSVAWAAASYATWSAARGAASSAAWSAASGSASSVAWSAARGAAYAAATLAAWDVANADLTARLEALKP